MFDINKKGHNDFKYTLISCLNVPEKHTADTLSIALQEQSIESFGKTP